MMYVKRAFHKQTITSAQSSSKPQTHLLGSRLTPRSFPEDTEEEDPKKFAAASTAAAAAAAVE